MPSLISQLLPHERKQLDEFQEQYRPELSMQECLEQEKYNPKQFQELLVGRQEMFPAWTLEQVRSGLSIEVCRSAVRPADSARVVEDRVLPS